ncbi:hypothetical protein PHYBLDRAFT_139901 [Phycomyces blakesleeanus NRRL 1555(-)]|uniref:Uncharacterized protein n=1 Tax=Phycomyces blakesleeanus (strain ATCC 8743b / DSM 1359 / FGSC 10004 / NBRC 33097 / NRRL 1555) TaxID=763407 RepID=A0A167QLM8_PHYB8|nr:hypothetical protein PHYBLDRAFT_139901 [Phycomyces blakesleeanus NRRL 1555(-)]OAD79888.1 hypothetical protein PHYBLDRAFT_139901 [Phycomyces blakesleeanus NRRL 1555(-)]|eukprot:XP_018297928.1 hypothetical protein PHYBLDRAFT_139901 [Phycomyces blakesleeanus NRRL 1555(-)]
MPQSSDHFFLAKAYKESSTMRSNRLFGINLRKPRPQNPRPNPNPEPSPTPSPTPSLPETKSDYMLNNHPLLSAFL